MIWNDTRKAAARASCKKWGGTPHYNRLAVAGTGIDCVHLVSEILRDSGIIPAGFPMPFYDERLGSLRQRNVIEDIIAAYMHADSLPPDTAPEFGDIVVCQCGRQSNHVGIIIDGEMWHVPGRGRVGPSAWVTWKKKTQALMRLTADGFKVDPSGLTWEAIRTRLTA